MTSLKLTDAQNMVIVLLIKHQNIVINLLILF